MKEELLREFRVGDKVRVKPLIIKGRIALKEDGDRYHVSAWEDDSQLELPHRVFYGYELEGLKE